MSKAIYKMRHILIPVILFGILFIGCKKDCNPVTTPVDDRIPFEINYLQYSENNYFLDTVYANTSEYGTFNLYYGKFPPAVLPKYYIKNIEVYKSINQISDDIESIFACVYIDLPPRSSSDMYSDLFRNINIVTPGNNLSGRFKLLSKNNDYIFHAETGYITFLNPIQDDDVYAAAFRIENNTPSDSDDLYYGEFISELVSNSKKIGVLKLIKPNNLQPFFKEAWQLKMKNIYQVTPSTEPISNLDFDIYLKKSDGTESNKINNMRLLELFGFDKMNEEGTPGTDGKFDNISGINYEPNTGEIIFPFIQPFGDNIPAVLKNYKYQAIYDTVKSYLSLPGNSFIIKGKYNTH